MAAHLADFIEAHEGNNVMLGNLAQPATKHYADATSVSGSGYVTYTGTVDLSTDDPDNIWQNVPDVAHVPMSCTKVGNSVVVQINGTSAIAVNSGVQIMASAESIPGNYRPDTDQVYVSVLLADNGAQIPAYVLVYKDGSFLIKIYGVTLLQAAHSISFHTLCVGYNKLLYPSD
jgi:hypothetical protein